MANARDPRTLRLYGRALVLLGIRNELRARRAPFWRQERNRIEIDRALAELSAEAHPIGAGSDAAQVRASSRSANRLSATP
jgi:hypothetical protein